MDEGLTVQCSLGMPPVRMRGTGRAANVYWRATDTSTVGTHLALNGITSNLGTAWNFGSRATVDGRLISLGGSVDVIRTTVDLRTDPTP